MNLLPTKADLDDALAAPLKNLLSGITVAIVALPLALAFGLASGMGAEAGITTAIIAGALAAKKRLPANAGTFPTHGPLFVVLLIGTVLLVGLLNYVPSLALGPVVEHLMLWPK